jgi:hypothetical protein
LGQLVRVHRDLDDTRIHVLQQACLGQTKVLRLCGGTFFSQGGALLGMQGVIGMLFIYCLVSLRMRVVSEQQKRARSQLEKIALIIEAKKIRNDLLDR